MKIRVKNWPDGSLGSKTDFTYWLSWGLYGQWWSPNKAELLKQLPLLQTLSITDKIKLFIIVAVSGNWKSTFSLIFQELARLKELYQQAEVQAAVDAALLQEEINRREELERLQTELQHLLETERRAKEEEEKARALQEKMLEDEKKRMEELERLRLEQERLLKEEMAMRENLEEQQKQQEKLLEDEVKMREELQEQHKQQEKLLEEVSLISAIS